MAIHYKDGFFNDDFGGFVPEDAVKISEEKYVELLNGQAEGKQIIADSTGKPILIEPQPSSAHELKNGEWIISPEKMTALFAQQKEALLNTLANKTDKLKSGLLVGYPQTEIDSFYRQEKEALAWQADNTTETPMLSQIAEIRGMPFEILVRKVLEKSNRFAIAVGAIIGQRQAFEDRWMTVKTTEELTALEEEINQWHLNAN